MELGDMELKVQLSQIKLTEIAERVKKMDASKLSHEIDQLVIFAKGVGALEAIYKAKFQLEELTGENNGSATNKATF